MRIAVCAIVPGMEISDTHYRMIVSSDWHADASTLGVDRYPEIESAALSIVQHTIAVDHGEERTVFVFAGDLTNPDNSRCWRAVQLATRVAYGLADHGIPSVWITGNHDIVEDGQGSSTLMPIANGNPRITVVDEPMLVEPHSGMGLVCFPYCARSRNYNPEHEVSLAAIALANHDLHEPFAVVSHLMLEGISAGSETKDFPRGRDVFLPIGAIRKQWPTTIMINGHYHAGQIYREVHIPGSLARLTLGEAASSPRYLEVVR